MIRSSIVCYKHHSRGLSAVSVELVALTVFWSHTIGSRRQAEQFLRGAFLVDFLHQRSKGKRPGHGKGSAGGPASSSSSSRRVSAGSTPSLSPPSLSPSPPPLESSSPSRLPKLGSGKKRTSASSVTEGQATQAPPQPQQQQQRRAPLPVLRQPTDNPDAINFYAIITDDAHMESLREYLATVGKLDAYQLFLRQQPLRSWTMLHWAAAFGLTDLGSDLLESVMQSTCDPRECLSTQDALGRSPLHVAAEHNCSAFVGMLCDYGANPSISDQDNQTAFHIAAGSKDSQLTWILLQGCPSSFPFARVLNIADEAGSTPLHYFAATASSRSSPEYVEERLVVLGQLLARGADPRRRNLEGLTPIDIAARRAWTSFIHECIFAVKSSSNRPSAGNLSDDDADQRPSPTSNSRPRQRDRSRSQSKRAATCLKGVAVAANDQWSPLHLLAATGHAGCIARLVKGMFGTVALGSRGPGGRTAIHLAMKRGHVATVRIILRHLPVGALMLQDDIGKLPVDLCTNTECIELFEDTANAYAGRRRSTSSLDMNADVAVPSPDWMTPKGLPTGSPAASVAHLANQHRGLETSGSLPSLPSKLPAI